MIKFNPVTAFLKISFDTPEEGQKVFNEIKYLRDNKNPLMPDLTVDGVVDATTTYYTIRVIFTNFFSFKYLSDYFKAFIYDWVIVKE